MSKHAKHVAKHRAAPKRAAVLESPRRVVRHTVVMSSVAVAVTGVAVAGGVLGGSRDDGTPAASGVNTSAEVVGSVAPPQQAAAPAVPGAAQRAAGLSRSADRRSETDRAKAATLLDATGPTLAGRQDLADADPRDIARALLGDYGFSDSQFECLDLLWTRESHWNVHADNPHSSAYGIPQSLPGSKMASVGPDWADNPVTQIKWGLGYIKDRYGSPCGAWGHSQSHGFY